MKTGLRPPAQEEEEEAPMASYYLGSQVKGYEGDHQWVIELEKGWSPWLLNNEPFEGSTSDGPIRYSLGTLAKEQLVGVIRR
eukprot:Skav227744  [mRNA]  locus=scaffold3513:229035:230747:- [translate_table: standard]